MVLQRDVLFTVGRNRVSDQRLLLLHPPRYDSGQLKLIFLIRVPFHHFLKERHYFLCEVHLHLCVFIHLCNHIYYLCLCMRLFEAPYTTPLQGTNSVISCEVHLHCDKLCHLMSFNTLCILLLCFRLCIPRRCRLPNDLRSDQRLRCTQHPGPVHGLIRLTSRIPSHFL